MYKKIYILLIGILATSFLVFLTGIIEVSAQNSNISQSGENNESTMNMYALFAAVLSGGGISVLGSFLTTHINNNHNLKVMGKKDEIDRKAKEEEFLRDKRIELYTELWKITRSDKSLYSSTIELADKLNDWYNIGGIYLGVQGRKYFFELRDLLIKTNYHEVTHIQKERTMDNIPTQERIDINKMSEILRASLSVELGVKTAEFPTPIRF